MSGEELSAACAACVTGACWHLLPWHECAGIAHQGDSLPVAPGAAKSAGAFVFEVNMGEKTGGGGRGPKAGRT
jgi:hypothetical protein